MRKVHGQGEYKGEYGMGGGKEACETTRFRKRARVDYWHRPEEGRISQVLPILFVFSKAQRLNFFHHLLAFFLSSTLL